MCMSGSLCPNSSVPTVFKYIQHIQKHMGFQTNALAHIRSSVGTPVTLHVPIVVHLAVLCSTLFSQHASHLKPNTYGPASCRSRALLVLRTFHLAPGDACFLTDCGHFALKSAIFCKTLWWAASNARWLPLEKAFWWIKAVVSNARWFNLQEQTDSTVLTEAWSVGQRRRRRDRTWMREGLSWREGVSPHRAGKQQIGQGYSNKRWSYEILLSHLTWIYSYQRYYSLLVCQ